MRRPTLAVTLSCLALASGAARAQGPAAAGKAACFDAASSGQSLRDAHKLLEARDQFRICASQACPAVVQRDCLGWLDSVQKDLPTVVPAAKDAAGADLADVTVTVDGKPFASRLDGSALAIDPGPHAFHFQRPDGAAADKQVIVKQGDHDLDVAVVLKSPGPSPATAAPPAVAVAPTPSPSPEPSPEAAAAAPGAPRSKTMKTVGLTTAGVGLAVVAVGGIFGVLTGSAVDRQKGDCASVTTCPNHAQALADHSTATSDALISVVGLAAGGALVAGGAAMFFLGNRRSAAPAIGLRVRPAVGPGGGGLSVAGSF